MYDTGHYAAAHYIAGLAVECMLFACRIKSGGKLDAKHYLRKLWREAKFSDYLPKQRAADAGAAVSTVIARWLNNHRYRSDKELRHWLVDVGIARDQGSKDDPLKHSARLITNAALEFVTLGEETWRQL